MRDFLEVQSIRHPAIKTDEKYSAMFDQTKKEVPPRKNSYIEKKSTEEMPLDFKPVNTTVEAFLDIQLDKFADGDKKSY